MLICTTIPPRQLRHQYWLNIVVGPTIFHVRPSPNMLYAGGKEMDRKGKPVAITVRGGLNDMKNQAIALCEKRKQGA